MLKIRTRFGSRLLVACAWGGAFILLNGCTSSSDKDDIPLPPQSMDVEYNQDQNLSRIDLPEGD